MAGCSYPPVPADLIPARFKTPTSGARSQTTSMVSGKVFGLDGKPAGNVLVQGYLVSNNAGSLVNNNSAGLVSNNAGSLVSNNAGSYRTMAADGLSTYTRPDGTFAITVAQDQVLNVEAVLSDNIKAMAQAIPSAADVQMQLAYTGTITGKITVPEQPWVTDFLGADVYIPGTSYVAKTDAQGNFTLSNVAVGSFQLIASKQSFGMAAIQNVAVASQQTTQVTGLAMVGNAPIISQASPSFAPIGATITLVGDHFKTSSGETLSVSFNGTIATQVSRIDDKTLQVVVPTGATNGNVVATVGSVNSNGMNFAVIDHINLPDGNILLGLDEAAQVFNVESVDTAGHLVQASHPDLVVQGPITASYDAGQGFLVSGTSAGVGTLTIRLGNLSSQAAIKVLPHSGTVTTLAGAYHDEAFVDGAGALARFRSPYSLCAGPDGVLRIADTRNHRLRLLATDGTVSTLSGNGTPGGINDNGPNSPSCVAYDPQSGLLYFSETANNRIRAIDAIGNIQLIDDSSFLGPTGLCVGADGTLYVIDSVHQRICKIANGQVSTIAGSGTKGYKDGIASEAQFSSPDGIAVDAAGNLYVAEAATSCVRKIDAQGNVSTLAGKAWDPGCFPSRGSAARLYSPTGICVDGEGNVLVADCYNNDVSLILPDGNLFCLAGAGDALGVHDDGPAREALFWGLTGVTVGPDGSVFLSEGGDNSPRIRAISFN